MTNPLSSSSSMAPQTQKQLTRSWTTRRDENAGACNLFSPGWKADTGQDKIIERSRNPHRQR